MDQMTFITGLVVLVGILVPVCLGLVVASDARLDRRLDEVSQ